MIECPPPLPFSNLHITAGCHIKATHSPCTLSSQMLAIPVFPSSTWLCFAMEKSVCFNTLRTGDADLRFYTTTVQDG